MGVGGQDTWTVNVLLAARDLDEQFDVSNFFVLLPSVELSEHGRTEGRTLQIIYSSRLYMLHYKDEFSCAT